jgi:AAA+ ATPase superfamily predicted ATPase
MFFDREAELRSLETWWHGTEPEFITVYGRRQVGKTELLVRFLEGKDAVYYYADRQPLTDQLRAFTRQVLLIHDDPLLHLQPFSSWEAAITYMLRLAGSRRMALVLDEFSYAADSDPALASILQRLWDGARRDGSKLFLVLCTSFTEAVERHFAIDAPLYRRRTRQLVVQPFSYRDASHFFSSWPRLDRILGWCIIGGIPSYLRSFGSFADANLGQAVIDNVLDKTSTLYSEADVLLGQEVRGVSASMLRGILGAVAYGCTEPNEIAQRVGRPITSLSGALRFLVDYGILERRVPFTIQNPERTRSTHYYVSDNYLAFWFRFVLPNRSLLEQGRGAEVWRNRIEPALGAHVGGRFEEACRQFIRLHPDRWQHVIVELGIWWRASDELEIVGLNQNREVVLAAEAKWTESPVDLAVLHTLQRRVALLPNVVSDHQLVLFAKSGFSEAVRARATAGLILVTADEMLP